MGIQDRDYMKGKSGEGGSDSGPLDQALESVLGDIFRKRNP
jgi:hypothetical protein